MQTSQSIIHKDVKNTYQKGDLFCVYINDKVYKYPIVSIFSIEEDYEKYEE